MTGKKIEKKNNPRIAPNVLYVKKNEYIYPAYISRRNLNHKSQIILLMIQKRERWHHLAV